MIVYKVVNNNGGDFESCVSELIVKYTIGQKSLPQPGTYGLYVFKNLQDAKSFANPDQSILKCNAKNVRAFQLRTHYFDILTIYRFWNEFASLRKKRVNSSNRKSYNNIGVFNTPAGSYICSELIPLEVV